MMPTKVVHLEVGQRIHVLNGEAPIFQLRTGKIKETALQETKDLTEQGSP